MSFHHSTLNDKHHNICDVFIYWLKSPWNGDWNGNYMRTQQICPPQSFMVLTCSHKHKKAYHRPNNIGVDIIIRTATAVIILNLVLAKGDISHQRSLFIKRPHLMMTSWNGNIFRVTGPLCREFTGHRWIPRAKASDAELWCFLLSVPE